MVEYALKKLKDLSVSKKYKLPASKEKTVEAVNKLNSTIKIIKFSYIPPLNLVDDRMVREFDLMANQFSDAVLKNYKEVEKDKLIATELKFIFNILTGFRGRLKLGNEASLEKSIDLIAVKIVSVTKFDTKENLRICKVSDGKKIMNVITNLTGIKKDMVLPVAILPPREFGSEISEAMFCSSKNLPEMDGHAGEYVENLPENDLKEVKHHVLELIKEI